MKFLLLLLPLLAQAHDDPAADAARQKLIDPQNLKLVLRMIQVERVNGGQNQTGKCYDTTYDFEHSWIPVPWSYKGYSLPIYSRRTLAWQAFQNGFANNVILACTFNTNNGYVCKVEDSTDEDSGKTEQYVTCYDKNNRRFVANGAGKLVKYVAPPPSEPTPISECARRELDWMQSQQQCNQMNDSHDRDLCLQALGNDPGGCNR